MCTQPVAWVCSAGLKQISLYFSDLKHKSSFFYPCHLITSVWIQCDYHISCLMSTPPLSQLQTSFGTEDRLSQHRELTIQPKEDMSVHLLYTPTRVACMLAKLEIKQCSLRPSQPGIKFTVSFFLWTLLTPCVQSHFMLPTGRMTYWWLGLYKFVFLRAVNQNVFPSWFVPNRKSILTFDVPEPVRTKK